MRQVEILHSLNRFIYPAKATTEQPSPGVRSRLTPFVRGYHQVDYCRRIDDLLLPNLLPDLHHDGCARRQRLVLDTGSRRNRHSAVKQSTAGMRSTYY